MINTRAYNVPRVMIAFVAALALVGFIPPSMASTSGGIDPVMELLSTSQMLTPGQRDMLSGLIRDIVPSEENLSGLQKLSFKLEEKIEYDKGRLKILLMDLEKLSGDEYTRTFGAVKAADLKACRKILGELERNITARRPSPIQSERDMNAAHYLKVIGNNSLFLVGGEGVAIPDLWESIRTAVRPAYLSWNRRYRDLLDKLKKRHKEFDSSSSVLTYEELGFIKMFGAVQSGLRLFSGENTGEF